MLLCDSFFYTISPTFLCLLFAYRSLIVRLSFAHCSLIVRLLFAYRSLIVRLLFAYCSLIVRSSFAESKGKLTYWLILYVFC